MNEIQREKQTFVMEYLEPLLRAIDQRISSVTYVAYDYKEVVRIAWTDKSGNLKDATEVCVTYDSKAAIVQDVIKTFL